MNARIMSFDSDKLYALGFGDMGYGGIVDLTPSEIHAMAIGLSVDENDEEEIGAILDQIASCAIDGRWRIINGGR
jgi:hypothetical protein